MSSYFITIILIKPMLLSRDTEARPCGSEEKFCDINLTAYNDHTMAGRPENRSSITSSSSTMFSRSVRTIFRPAVNGRPYHVYRDRSVKAPKLLRLVQKVK